MNNQFFYIREETIPARESGGEPEIKKFQDSFNINRVLRTQDNGDGKLWVILDDFHREKREVPVRNKQGKVTAFKNEENTYQSNLLLLPEDAKRYKFIVEIDIELPTKF